MKIWKETLRRNREAIMVFVAMTTGNAVIFTLYGISLEPLLYSAVLAFILLLALLVRRFFREKRRSLERASAEVSITASWRTLPEADSLAEEEYQNMIALLGAELERLAAEADAERQDMLDYYTAWVHQIKTPIAVMRLKLSQDTAEHHALRGELQRIEQYVDMVLQYVRISSGSNDLVIREYALDELIREAIRKQATQFVQKRLRLCYTPMEAVIVTDQKWFVCILDQLLSNAVKYTNEGTVTVEFREGLLKISDTGIGIAAEDLPRIFEKGYTGSNGRLEQKSSGLGLYLAKKSADLLSIPLRAESTVGGGSTFTLDLRQK